MAEGFQTGLEGKPWYVSAAVAAGLAAAIVIGAKVAKFDDMNNAIRRMQGQHAELEKKINEARTAQRSLPQFEEVVQNLELELEKLLLVLPARRNTEDLLRRVRLLAEQGNFNLLRFTPRRQSEREFYYEWPIQINVDATYHNLALFFDRVSRFSRIINIEDLRILTQKQSGAHTVSATFTLKTYLYIEDTEEGDSL
ncbi:MAG: type 4a pilus biogenesis protein PilO [Thermoanaerobaculia bacterium]|nr:type 4a pilus biogenesis protein PilO [Thermoanaerobaculia bacterium]